MSKRNTKKNVGAQPALVNLSAGWISHFVTAWIIMLASGALLGDEGLWTPAYWQVFWALYVVTALVSFTTRSYYENLKILAKRDTQQSNSEPVI